MLRVLRLRPSCYCCPYARAERAGDLTLADFRETEKIRPVLDDDKGLSPVAIISPRGAATAVRLHLHRPAAEPPERAGFWRDYQSRGYRYILRRYADYSFAVMLKDLVKRLTGRAQRQNACKKGDAE